MKNDRFNVPRFRCLRYPVNTFCKNTSIFTLPVTGPACCFTIQTKMRWQLKILAVKWKVELEWRYNEVFRYPVHLATLLVKTLNNVYLYAFLNFLTMDATSSL